MSGTSTLALSVDRIINVSLAVAPIAVVGRNFGQLLAITDTNVIDPVERVRVYKTLAGVANDHGTGSQVYAAAAIFFAQIPTPPSFAVGTWVRTGSPGILHGAYLTPTQQLLSNFQSITNASLSFTIDGTVQSMANISLAGVTTLPGLANLIQTSLGGVGHSVVTWDGLRFNVASTTTGIASSVNNPPVTPPIGSTDISALLGLNQAQSLLPVPGFVAETALQAVQACYNRTSSWYGLEFAATPGVLMTADILNVAAFIEGSSIARIYGITSNASALLSSTSTTDILYELNQLAYRRTLVLYSNTPHAVAGFFGRAFSVNFQGSNTTLTMKFKIIVGVAPENLQEAQADALEGKDGNVYVDYDNGAAIVEQGQMVNGVFFDEVYGLDWLTNQVQVDLFNFYYQNATKVPQTDPGVTSAVNVLEQSLEIGVTNGLIAPGTWTTTGFGQLVQGEVLTKGYYVYAPPVSTQDQADREARQAPVCQAAIKLAGAIHSMDILLNVNR